jgi:hypothetical protein
MAFGTPRLLYADLMGDFQTFAAKIHCSHFAWLPSWFILGWQQLSRMVSGWLTVMAATFRFRHISRSDEPCCLDFQEAMAQFSPLELYYLHFVKVHQTIRCTPAMEAGVANSAWTVQDLVTMTGA